MDSFFDNNLNQKNLIEYYINPLTPYFICDHYISTEIKQGSPKYIAFNLELKANDLLKNQNYNDINNFDIIQIQVDHFDFFYDQVLPFIILKNIQVIIITSQWFLPQIHQNSKTDNLLNNICE
jgi:hypothetical protein